MDQETSRATKVETQLSEEIASKASQTDLDAERKKRSEDDQALSGRIDIHTAQLSNLATIVEENEQENNEKILALQVDTVQLGKQLSDEVSRATTSEQQLSSKMALKVDQTDFEGERTARYEEDLALQQALEKESQRAEKAETQLASKVSSTETEILSHDKRLQATSMQIGEEIERAVNAERSLALLIGAKADRENTYTKSDVDRIIEKTLSGGSCSCCGDAAILINLNASNEELWEKLSSNINSRFNGYLTMGEEIFNLHVTFNPLGEKVEISRTEGMRVEFILLEKNADGSISRSEEFTEYIY